MALGSIKGLFGKGWQLLDDIHLVKDFIGPIFSGKEAIEDGPAAVRGLSGIWGDQDERQEAVDLIQLDKEDQEKGTPFESRQIIMGFYEWSKLPGKTWEVRLTNWWYRNTVRSYIGKMGRSDGTKIGTERTVKATYRTTKANQTKKPNSTITTTTTDVKSSGSNNSLAFYHKMVEIVKSKPTREEGYAELFQKTNLPKPPKDALKFVKRLKRKYGAKKIEALAKTALQKVAGTTQKASLGLVREARRREHLRNTTRRGKLKKFLNFGI